jgi:hypothetical protein
LLIAFQYVPATSVCKSPQRRPTSLRHYARKGSDHPYFREMRRPNRFAHAEAVAVRNIAWRGTECGSWPTTGSRPRGSFIPGQTNASPSTTQGGSRVREFRSRGSVRGAVSNDRSYRDSERVIFVRNASKADRAAGQQLIFGLPGSG